MDVIAQELSQYGMLEVQTVRMPDVSAKSCLLCS